ncbi:HAD family acid phosphatase [Streptomyces sp. NPDC097981]|uniref:phosphatase domain-containing protein n=1 Tax=Streptomyces sp. NPDC097981 TaxID=3155428 RepID=UPI00332073E2
MTRMSDSNDRRPLAVFDIDNTLADTDHRQHFLERRPRDWDGFFGAAPADPPLARGVALAVERAADCEVVYLTGRPERCRADTEEWLTRHGLPEGRLWMRGNQDRRPARTTKLEVLRRIARGREVRMLVDDDELVCQAARAAGFTVVLADWAADAPELKTAQEGEGRT